MVCIIKKDGTKEEFNVQKVLAAVNKSANRAMIIFSKAESKFICEFVEEKAEELDQSEVPIAQMHNIVEGALERVNPVVAKSYRDYRNYKQDFVQMLDEVYKKSQSIHLEELIAAKERELDKISRYKQSLYQDWKDGKLPSKTTGI